MFSKNVATIVLALLVFAFCQNINAQVSFDDASASRGILPNVIDIGFGAGVAAFDYDEDGDIDLYLPQRLGDPDRLYQNDGNGIFTDIGAATGIDVDRAGRSALWFDYDDDHLVDLLIASDCFNSTNPNCIDETTIRLYRQTASGQFVDVTVDVGLSDAGIAQFFGHRSGICCGDIDRDGDLDLLIGQWEGELQLFINETGTFVDQTLARGIMNPNAPFPTNSWQSVMHDFNGDGWLDIYTAVDFFDNQLWLNQQDGTFVDVAASSGTNFAFNDMGVTVGDYDNDGDFDLYVTNIFEHEKHNLLLRNESTEKSVLFSEVSESAGVNNTEFGWGATFFDANNDTKLDLAVTNGWFNGPGINDSSRLYLQSDNIAGTFDDISESAGFDDMFFGSCLVSADINRDGDLDLLQVCNPASLEGPFRVLENQLNENGKSNWLSVRPRQAGKNHWSIGAIVRVEIGDLTMSRSIGSGTSIHGQEPAEAFFGLGDAQQVDRISVTWPHGDTTIWENVAANQIFNTDDADLNTDGDVNLLDVSAFIANLGPCTNDCQADFDHNGTIDFLDAMIFVDAILDHAN